MLKFFFLYIYTEKNHIVFFFNFEANGKLFSYFIMSLKKKYNTKVYFLFCRSYYSLFLNNKFTKRE